MKKNVITLLLAGTMLVGMLAGCGSTELDNKEKQTAPSQKTEEPEASGEVEEEDPFLTGEKPELNILAYSYSASDMNENMLTNLVEELTGYEVVFHQYDASDDKLGKLLLEIASGTSYDLITGVPVADYRELVDKNTLMEISGIVDKYGNNMKEAISEIAWNAMTQEDGTIYGLANENARLDPTDLTGAFSLGLAFKNESLKELGMKLPTNLNELYDVLTAYKEATGNAPLTITKTAWINDIMSAYGMGAASWYEVDGTYVYRVYHEGMDEYIAYVQKLYREGLLDPDMPIDTIDIVDEKFTTTALCTQTGFTKIPEFIDALYANNPDDKIVFSCALAKDENSKGIYVETLGLNNAVVIPKTSQNPEHALIFMDILSSEENFERVYIGEEGVSFEIVDGNYYPLFPVFSDYSPSNYWAGFAKPAVQKKMWMARARKTPEMAEAFEQMNENANSKDYYASPEVYANTVPEIVEYFSVADAAVSDVALKGIVEGTDPETVVKQMIEAWEREGGLECNDAMQAWYLEHKAMFE